MDSEGRTIWIADAHRDDGKRFVVRADEKLTAFVEPESSSGRLGTLTSSARFKQDIHSMDKASEAILALQPVTFRYKQELDPKGIPQFGLVAEQWKR